MAKSYTYKSVKDPDDVIFPFFDWTATPLSDGETITGASVAVTSASGASTDPTTITVDFSLIDGAVTRSMCSGGLDKTSYVLKWQMVTNLGMELNRFATLKVAR